MKRNVNVLVIAGLAVLSTNAFASKARVQALGQDGNRGSEYIADSRNVFRNPAALNETKNYLVTEWGTAVNSDANNAPRAEGGFFREMGAFNYGLYLGNDGSMNTTRVANGFLAQDNALDLFIAGDMGVKWGARLHYAGGKDEATTAGVNKKNTAYGIGLGVVAGAIEGYANVDISDKSEGAAASGDEWKLKPSYLVGGSFTWTDYTFFASYENTKAEQKLAAANTTAKTSAIVVGAGRTMEINPTARVFGDVKVSIASSEDTTGGAAAGKTKTNTLPVTFGMEADATSWLTLRGAVSQNVFLNETKDVNGKKKTNANQTFVNAGATLNFGKLKVDGLIGTSDAARNGTVSANNGTNQGTLTTDNLLTKVAVSYWF
ncbi:hypothetical protein SHI21_11000 [Bacteriovorax sp. PP10]|uniref:Major outer membrane protein n=1 Tax=Bacteriovorax antarcticus TaxID=3088717 RepID=A0ABU5VUK4_9BACT|nr:hypothetical protein [Bacteriovorax sp. PP10]MEA9356737.1 hypothetical protein [Bacteriovorax sp. PP10]